MGLIFKGTIPRVPPFIGLWWFLITGHPRRRRKPRSRSFWTVRGDSSASWGTIRVFFTRKMRPRWFKVTFWSSSWRSLNLSKKVTYCKWWTSEVFLNHNSGWGGGAIWNLWNVRKKFMTIKVKGTWKLLKIDGTWQKSHELVGTWPQLLPKLPTSLPVVFGDTRAYFRST